MPQTEERNLELTPRNIGTRDRRPGRTIQFELSAITNRFTNNLLSIKSQFKLAEQLKNEGNMQYTEKIVTAISDEIAYMNNS